AHPEKTARDYMSSPVIGIEATATIRAADELMLHFGLKAIPVFQPGTRICAGLLDAQTAARATGHGLGDEQVLEYMQRRVVTLGPDALLSDLAEVIIGGRQRLVPIVEKEEVAGVVTRTDLINVFANEYGSLGGVKKQAAKKQNISKLLRDRLDGESQRVLRLAGELGKKMRLPVYAVGGFVRDILMDKPTQDIDIVAEGNGIAFARELARALGGRVREHQKFLTAVVIYHDSAGVERHVDVATARLEYYEYPAALPTVELSSLKMDLLRRDFSINALAVRLDGDFYGEVEDFFGGRRDLKDRLIRVLHTLSFVEDPTRCIRAVRFEQRYKFRIGPGTEKLIRNILPKQLLEKLSPERLFNEIRHLCNEESGAACFERLDNLGILKTLNPLLALTPQRRSGLKRAQEVLAWYRLLYFDREPEAWICYYYALTRGLNYTDAASAYAALGLPPAQKTEVLQQREKLRSMKSRLLDWQAKADKGMMRISQLCNMLKSLNAETLLHAMAIFENEGLEKNISRFITRWQHEKPDINGHDLKRLGIEPGPIYGEILRAVLEAKLDGAVTTPKSQLGFALEYFKKQQGRQNEACRNNKD
ncbi:MAG: CBS domain-containing protein, partial [Desulfovibrio sp.]|nr:CBS domain-containing protein [Desulfovibrio sp.]